jgi:hypothetical protein
VHLVAFSIERGNRLLMFVLLLKGPSSFAHRSVQST